MTTWAILLILWVAPALVLLAALVRANMRKSARRRIERDAAGRKAAKRPKSAPAE
jgi:cytochrome c-type biogenesis protein CcmH/NrfF